jgi:serine/threonine protein kinase
MSLTIGQILQDNYRIAGPLGHGGMGAVYLAEHTRLAGRRFAIKENIPEPNADPQTLAELRNQFYVEAKTLAALDHPNLPKVSDYFTVGANEYLVMDFVEGETLQQVFDRHVQQFRTPLPEKSVLGWADQVLDALAYLHNQRPSPIVHRDIKPGNIILAPNGVVKLVDFGLVKLMGPGGQDTALALRGLGTPAYTALEQYPGSQSHTDARTDLYGLGATLYHLLTGAPPANRHYHDLRNHREVVPRSEAQPEVVQTTTGCHDLVAETGFPIAQLIFDNSIAFDAVNRMFHSDANARNLLVLRFFVRREFTTPRLFLGLADRGVG